MHPQPYSRLINALYALDEAGIRTNWNLSVNLKKGKMQGIVLRHAGAV